MDNRPIGIFDSGLGGLTVVNAMKDALPDESFVYVGDTARIPYGEKDVDTLHSYGRQIVSFLEKEGVKAIIVSCGTISSTVIEDLREEFRLPLIDVAYPGIESALEQVKKRIGIIATEATIKSGFFQKTIKEKNPALDVEAKACPLFVPLIEEGWPNSVVTARVVEAYLRDWQENPIDTLILGCTHYPLLSSAIQQVLGDVPLIDMSIAAVKNTHKYLIENGLLKKSSEISRKFYVSGDTEKFNYMGKQITGLPTHAQKIYWE